MSDRTASDFWPPRIASADTDLIRFIRRNPLIRGDQPVGVALTDSPVQPRSPFHFWRAAFAAAP
ncbi:hypothetical protein ACFQ07_24870, partial [Actinomadura adrarensis]